MYMLFASKRRKQKNKKGQKISAQKTVAQRPWVSTNAESIAEPKVGRHSAWGRQSIARRQINCHDPQGQASELSNQSWSDAHLSIIRVTEQNEQRLSAKLSRLPIVPWRGAPPRGWRHPL
jgi:hypothetical protein